MGEQTEHVYCGVKCNEICATVVEVKGTLVRTDHLRPDMTLKTISETENLHSCTEGHGHKQNIKNIHKLILYIREAFTKTKR